MRRVDDTSDKAQPINTLISALLILIAGHSTAYAYLDLGTGSFILQAALAGLAAAWVTCSMYWQRIKSLFQRKSPDDEPASPIEKSEQRDTP